MIRRAVVVGAFAAFIVGSNAIADDCKLGRVSSLDFTDEGGIVIPVSIEGKSVSMAVDTGAEASAVDPVVATNLRLVEERIPQGFVYNAQGEQFTYLAVIHDFAIGDLRADRLKMLVWPSPLSRGDVRLAGLLGSEVLHNYDVDIDFGAHKFNLFSQDHCPGRVVYWTSGNVVVAPIRVLSTGHIVVPVSIDDHSLEALIDTGASYSMLSDEFARAAFGLTPQSADMAKVGEVSGAVPVEVYKHTFRSLSLDGLAIGNPTLLIRENQMKYSMTQAPHIGSRLNSPGEAGGQTDLTLGIAELRHLHLYIAYKEQKLYITPASAPAPATANGPTAAASTPPAAH